MKRDNSIDILRFIGLSLLILAHVDSPFSIKELRMFDVPLMVFVSGLSYGNKTIKNVKEFYKSRIKRLLIPVWSYVLIYFISIFICVKMGFLRTDISWASFIQSFIFYSDIGYIWIYKVFFFIALLTPMLIWVNKVVSNHNIYMIVVLGVVMLQQLFCFLWGNSASMVQKSIAETYGLYIIGYVPLFMLGLRVRNCSKVVETRCLFVVITWFIVGLLLYVYNNGLSFQLSLYKYPPQAYYLIYGCAVSFLLWYFRKYMARLFDNRLTRYIAKNTDWIYLWHAYLVLYVTAFIKNWFLQYILIYFFALLLCCFQKKIVARIPNTIIQKYF